MLGSAKSEHPKLTNRDIIFEEFQPTSSQSINITEGRQTDDMRSQDRALHCSASRGKNDPDQYSKSDRHQNLFSLSLCEYAVPPKFCNQSVKLLIIISRLSANTRKLHIHNGELRPRTHWRQS